MTRRENMEAALAKGLDPLVQLRINLDRAIAKDKARLDIGTDADGNPLTAAERKALQETIKGFEERRAEVDADLKGLADRA